MVNIGNTCVKVSLVVAIVFFQCCSIVFSQSIDSRICTDKEVTVGAKRIDQYIMLLEGKRVAVVANQTSVVGSTHLVDTLLTLGVDVKKVFAPEHGFRGSADAGEQVKNDTDVKTGLPILSLYGNKKKPTEESLSNVDVIVFDIQDVGARFYTYISTMHYVMEACAEQGKSFIVLDRPNPHGYYVDGPILDEKYESFVGKHKVPVIHGMTIAEYALMVNEEGWLKDSVKCDLKYVRCKGYDHSKLYQLPIAPSPNLKDMGAVYLYPSLCFFEGTEISVGRGTDTPFKVFGHPDLEQTTFEFIPRPVEGAKHPKHKGKICKGFNLSDFGKEEIIRYEKLYLHWLIGAYQNYPDKEKFFNKNGFFNLLAGNSILKQQIIDGWSEERIRKTWEHDLESFQKIRYKYLLYPDYE